MAGALPRGGKKKKTTKCYTQKMFLENENIILHHYNSYHENIKLHFRTKFPKNKVQLFWEHNDKMPYDFSLWERLGQEKEDFF